MSTKNKKSSATGVRYSDNQKKEVVDFVIQYNSKNGRGGQSAAAKKYKITPLTITAWLKGAGALTSAKAAPKKAAAKKPAAKKPAAKKAVKTAKQAKAPKVAGKMGRGSRYTAEKKQEILDFVAAYNAANGRGGQSKAVEKYNLSAITCASWLKAAGMKSAKGTAKKAKAVKPAKAAKPAKAVKAAKAVKGTKAAVAAPSGLAAKVAALLVQVRNLEAQIASLA